MGPVVDGGNGAGKNGKELKMEGLMIGTKIKILSGIYKGCKGVTVEEAVPCEFDMKHTVQKVEIKTLEHGDTLRYMPEVTMLEAI